MTRLSSEQVLEENKAQDPLAICTLKLNHKALADINCLGVFKNLEKLDLTFNNLTSLEGLKSCTNLKWLSVVQNRLESLKGIEELSKLTVLNAGKNKLHSIEEIRSLVGLCALILNDNEIRSICKLDGMKNLNTLVLSRNPIHSIGNSLSKMKSIKKLSFSNCKLQSLDSSLKSCTELKELRLAHNEIRMLPADLVHNKKLQNLDIGYNVITRWSDLKVLNSLDSLRNLNLQGNPIAENAKLATKIRKVLPGLHVLNARPIDKFNHNEKGNAVDEDDDSSNKKQEIQNEKRDGKFKMDVQTHLSSQNCDGALDLANDANIEKALKHKKRKLEKLIREKKGPSSDDERDDGEKNNLKRNDAIVKEKRSKQKRPKNNDEVHLKENSVLKEAGAIVEKKKGNKVMEGQVDVIDIDNTEASFAELFAHDDADNNIDSSRGIIDKEAIKAMDVVSNMVSFADNRKKSKNHGRVSRLILSSETEIGMGGPSAWGDD